MAEKLTRHMQGVNTINSALTDRRNAFTREYKNGHMGSRVLTYEPALDREVYKTLKTFEEQGNTAYEHVRNNLNEYTAFQVETFIGERLNVGLSSFCYDLRDGKLYGQGMHEPLLDMIQRGRDCRDSLVSDVDKARQDAEIKQFDKIQSLFGSPDTKPGTTVISISPPGDEGSAYTHNFYDIFVLSENPKTKERFVAAHRYSSELSVDEYREKARALVPGYFSELQDQSIDSYFLSHPLVLDQSSDFGGKPDVIHASFHKDHEFLSTDDFESVKRQIAGLIVSYVNTLVATPDDEAFLNLTLNAIMNKADHVAERLRRTGVRPVVVKDLSHEQHSHVVHAEILKLGKQSVREVSTGCGSSSGFDKENRTASNLSSFNVADFGKDDFGSRSFNCPDCGEMNIRPVNQLISNCQHCGSEKVSC